MRDEIKLRDRRVPDASVSFVINKKKYFLLFFLDFYLKFNGDYTAAWVHISSRKEGGGGRGL